ncbi:MAG TPA: hypothetical protein VMG14_04955 [Thermoplasmata archaeon]|nr:hypothetical protein [Thermoplasmata archaeon]
MTASPLVRATARPRPFSEQVTDASHRYLLPVVGGAAAALGSLALLGRGVEIGPYVPLALVGLGAATVGSSLVYQHWRAAHRPRAVPPPTDLRGPPDPFPSPYPNRVTFLSVAVPEPRPVPHSGIGRAATSAGDRIWSQWENDPSGGLGATLAGPVAESAFVPTRGVAAGPFGDRDADLVRSPTPTVEPGWPFAPHGTPIESSVMAAAIGRRTPEGRSRTGAFRRPPYSEAELDALFPPERPAAESPANFPLASGEISPMPSPRPALMVEPEAVGTWAGPSRDSAAPSAPMIAAIAIVPTDTPRSEPSGRFRILPSLLSLRDPLYVETIHPIPPHLRTPARGRGALVGAPASSPRARATPARTECVGCLRSLSGFRGWVLCPGCHRALCRRCLGASFLASSEGFCSRCRPWHGPPVN